LALLLNLAPPSSARYTPPLTWNNGAQRIKGYTAGEIVGRHFSVFYPPESRAAGLPERLLQAAATQGRVEAEGWRIRRDGSRFWADAIISAIRDDSGLLQGFTKVTRDLTERKRLEEFEHVGELAAAAEKAREAEKTRIARELHDDLGQQLTAMKIGAVSLQQSLDAVPSTPEIAIMAGALVSETDTMLTSIRRIAADLRPTMLDDLGLLPAVEWLADDFSRRYGVKARASLSTLEFGFSETAATAIFRIVQEALTNVARHAQATSVTVSIDLTNEYCEVCIEDDGTGMQSEPNEKADSFGLLGISERVRQLNGTATFANRPEGGFRVRATLPVDAIARK
jgi:PAS domain S-box-containing protein